MKRNFPANFVNQISFFYEFVIDLIFPKTCVSCKEEGFWICPKCRQKIILVKSLTCPKCNRITKQGQVCLRCSKTSCLKGLIVAAHYNEGALKEAIHKYKYEGVSDIAKDLGKILSDILKSRWHKFAVLIPVPLHKKRQARRGYNQAELLAKEISQICKYKVINNKLVRIKFSKSQVELSGRARRENIKNAFLWKGKDEVKGKNVLVVDDVYTTGATLEECAKTLKSAGAKCVWAVVLAKV